MTAFRKWFVALALLVVVVGTASAAAYQCTANAGVPARVRGEGRTELVGDLLLNCTGDLPSPDLVANIQIFLSTNITSKIIDPATGTTEAVLALNEPSPLATEAWQQTVGTNMFRGVKAGDNSLLWIGVPLAVAMPPATLKTPVTTFRITNVRANAVQAFSAGQTFIPQQITMFVTLTSSTSIPINNPTQVVAAFLKGLDFAARNCDDSDSIGTGYAQCSPNNSDLYGDPTYTDQGMAGLLKFYEGFDAAWKKQIETSQNGAALGTIVSNSESGYVNATGCTNGCNGALGSATGTANTGTRLIARFAGIPAYVKIFVTTTAHGKSTSSTVSAVLVSVTDPTGTGGTASFPLTGTGTAKCASGVTTSYSILEVPLFGGAGAATWEITSASSAAVETVTFGVVVAYSSDPANNKPALNVGSPGTVSGNFAPISSDDKMSAVSPIPRFADLPITKNLIEISPCRTNLLFPFVTARGGFDTGIAISNTTADNAKGWAGGPTTNLPYNSRATNGACTLYYWGDKEDGTSLAKPVQKSGVINAGKQLVYTLFAGGAGIDATPGFQGYIIATCEFHLAHGFAFISDLGAQKLAMGYLPLVIPRNNGSRREPAGNVSSDSGYNH